jgi:hypothetical protein
VKERFRFVVAGKLLALLLAVVPGTTIAAESRGAISVRGHGSALSGWARDDVTRASVARLDGSEMDLLLRDSAFSCDPTAVGAAAWAIRGYVGERAVSTVRVAPATAAAAAAPTAVALLGRGERMRLAPVDPRTLQALGRGIAYGRAGFVALATSPDRTIVATGVPSGALVRLVAFDPFRRVAEIRLGGGEYHSVRALAWVQPDRLLAVVERMSRPYRRHIRERTLVVVDPLERRVISRRPLPKLAIQQTAVAGGRLVMLLGRSTMRDDRVTLVVAEANSVRTTDLVVGRRSGARVPAALAVPPSGARAVVVAASIGGPTRAALEIDLATLTVARHPLEVLAGRIAPAGFSSLQAVAVDERHVAVTGVVAATVRGETLPAGGAFVIGTERWTAKLLDPVAAYVRAREGRVLTFGPSARRGDRTGTGVTIFAADGRRLHRLYGTRRFHLIEFVGPWAHLLRIDRNRSRLAFNVRSGRSLGPLPPLREEVLALVEGRKAAPAAGSRPRQRRPTSSRASAPVGVRSG